MKAEEEVLKSHLLSHKRNLHYLLNCHKHWSSLIYNTSARQERHERRECNTSNTNATRMQRECNTSATQGWHECYTNDTSAKRVKNFDFDNKMRKKKFSHPYIYYMASERRQGEEQVHSKN